MSSLSSSPLMPVPCPAAAPGSAGVNTEGDCEPEEAAELWVSDREPLTATWGTGVPVLVGVEVVGLGVFPVGCGMGCTPWGMYKDGAAPLAALAGLYGTDTGRTTGLAGGTPEIQVWKTPQ